MTASSSNFNLSTEIPYMHQFYEWLTGVLAVTSGSYPDSYITGSSVSYSSSSNTITITFTASATLYSPIYYLTGVKGHVLLVSKQIGSNITI